MSKAVDILKKLEWSKIYSYCTGWPSCPICHGIKPGHGADESGALPDNSGHSEDCELKEAIKTEQGIEAEHNKAVSA